MATSSSSTSEDNNNKNVIDTVLNATNHYEVLGVSRNATTSEIRRAYLQRSVKVHPDKNHGNDDSQRATTAFQRVALAWQVLSDDSSRAEYDAAPPTDSCNDYDNNFNASSSSNGGGTTYYATATPPSFQEALFMFATVIGMMGGGGGTSSSSSSSSRGASATSVAANAAEALYWAEKFLQKDQNRSRSSSSVNGRNSSDTISKGQAAVAIGSSLKAASATAKAMGLFKNSKTLNSIDRAATVAQTAGAGAMLLGDRLPAIQKSLERNTGMNVDKLRGGLSAVQKMMQQQQQQQQNESNNNDNR